MQQAGKSRGRRYPDDLRQSVLAKLASGKTSLRQVSQEFRISVPTLIKWRKDEQRPPTSVSAVGSAENQSSITVEIQRLREENERLKEERDRLCRSIAVLVGQKIAD